MKCKKMHEIDRPKTVTKNGRKSIKGFCKKHGTKMNKFI